MPADWVVVIPSYNRVDTLKEKTLKVLQDHKIPASKIYVFVANEEQKKLYEEGLEKGSVGHIVVGVKGLAEVRNFIFDYFPKGKKLVEMDDDIRGFFEFDEKAHRHEKPLVSLEKVIERGFEECQKTGASLWGVYPIPNGFFMKPTVSTDLKFIIGSFWGCINPGKDKALKLAFGGEKEDYQRTIQFWERDGVVVRLNFVAPKTAYYKEPGGMQEGDRVAKQNKAVAAMIKKWPQYIKLNPRRKSGYPEIRLVQPKEEVATTSKRTTRKKKRTNSSTAE
jgi:hypothetical protein